MRKGIILELLELSSQHEDEESMDYADRDVFTRSGRFLSLSLSLSTFVRFDPRYFFFTLIDIRSHFSFLNRDG